MSTLDDALWEQEREITLRTFRVLLATGHTREVLAHFYNNDNPAGHWYFYVLQPSGRQLIQHAFGSEMVIEVVEVTSAEAAAEIDRIMSRRISKQNKRQEFTHTLQAKTPKKDVH